MKQENNSTNNRRRTAPILFSHSTTTTTTSSQSRRLKTTNLASSSSSKTNNNNNIYNKKDLQEEEDKQGVSVPKTSSSTSTTNTTTTTTSRWRRSSSPLVPNKSKSAVPSPTPNKDSINSSSGCRPPPPPPPSPIVDQFARPRHIRTPTTTTTTTTHPDPHKSTTTTTNQLLLLHSDPNNKNNNNLLLLLLQELQEKLALSEIEIKNLQSQVLSLKSDLDKAHSFNSTNLTLHLPPPPPAAAAAAAHSNFQPLTHLHHQLKDEESNAEYQTPSFKDIQKLIANKLQHPILNQNEATTVPTTTTKSSLTSPLHHPISIPTDEHRKLPVPVTAPPPPPPPPRPPARTTTTRKAPAFVEFYHSLTKREAKNQSPGPPIHNKPVATSAHSSIVGEFENRSAHLMAIKADIETKGDFINGLIQKVLAAAYTDIEDVLKFADWLDNQLSSLADERAVLKHFKWPERKADAMREAAIEYRELKVLESEISSYKDDTDLPCGAALKKIASLLDKSERSIQRLIKLRNSVMLNYQEYKIPTDWMLDSGIVRKIKQTSMKLAKMYMNRVTIELESVRNIERESAQEALMLQGVHFAYRAHQFAGGLDSETLCALEEIRQRVSGQQGGSRELLAGIPSS